MILQIEVYILDNEQPTSCPKCGLRTEFTETVVNEMIVQHHHCPQTLCQYKFIGEFAKEEECF
jgi:hypothetical protein